MDIKMATIKMGITRQGARVEKLSIGYLGGGIMHNHNSALCNIGNIPE